MSPASVIAAPRRGEVDWLAFDPATGAEMRSLHPGVIVPNDIGNQRSDLTIVVAITSNLRVARLPVGVIIPAGTAGLTRNSVAHCDHIYTTVDKSRLGTRIGRLPAAMMAAIDQALVRSLGL